MKLFLDTASAADIRKAGSWAQCDGISTNPALIAGEGKDYRYTLREILRVFDGPVAAAVLATDPDEMYREAHELARLDEDIIIDVPLDRTGLSLCDRLSREGLRVKLSLCYSAGQALLAARCGAFQVSPCLGPIDATGAVAVEMIRDISQVYDNQGFDTEIIVGELSHAGQVVDVALAGADGASVSLAMLEALAEHPFTAIGSRRNLEKWRETARDLPIKRIIQGGGGQGDET